MSLKAFHIFFILVSTALALGLGYWGLSAYSVSRDTGRLFLGVGSLLGAGSLGCYLIWFLFKMRKINS